MTRPSFSHRDAIEREADLPSISALRAFMMAANLRSFSRAADELGITQSGVSRAVRSIEEMTGRQLFERTGHGLILTDVGRLYHEEVAALLAELGAATMRLSTYGDRPKQLNIAVLPSMGAKWLAPRLGRFAAKNPDIAITVNAQIGHFDFEGTDFDAAIHYGNETWAGCLSEILMDEVVIPICAPALLRSPPSAQLLTDLPLIHHLHRPTAWREWFRELGMTHPDPSGGLRFEQYQMGIEAAKAGHGAILMPPFMVTEELETGSLVLLHKEPVGTPWRYYLVYPEAKRSKPAVQKFRSWIRAEAKRTLVQTAQILSPP